jgi:nicotinate phosphoribosyltransferase
MYFTEKDVALFIDHYQLTMAEDFFLNNTHNDKVAFDYFFRKNPFNGGYTVFAGISDLLGYLRDFSFSEESVKYLEYQNFDTKFIEFLKSFEFNGALFAPKEGTLVFPNEPVITVMGTRLECQLIETILLATINYQSLIATKACRMRYAAFGKHLMEMGSRRGQELGALSGAKAAIIGGFDSTANELVGKLYNVPVRGSMAHSYIMGHNDELTAFRTWLKNPAHKFDGVLLLDTYSTLKSGIKNAIIAAIELEKEGGKLYGVRLDSGDLATLSIEVRKMLDLSNLQYVKIIASNQLNEYVITSLIQQAAPIDIFGVGADLITGGDCSAHDGVYKLCSVNNKPKLKVSETSGKTTLPGIKHVCRYFDNSGKFYADIINVQGKEESFATNIFNPSKYFSVSGLSGENLATVAHVSSISTASANVKRNFARLPREYKRFENPGEYPVGISSELEELRDNLSKTSK